MKFEDDIIKLTYPYYTADKNRNISEFINKYGKEYNEDTDSYSRFPYSSNIEESKADKIYNAHSYHTKVPYKAIMRYILHYTDPGDIVFDGFSGSGMTGVAAERCGRPDIEFKEIINREMKDIKWGTRRCVLNDISPLAGFIGYNYNSPIDRNEFDEETENIIKEVENETSWAYETLHTIDGIIQYDINNKPIIGRINNIIYSNVYTCTECSHEFILWDVAVDKVSGAVSSKIKCPGCGLEHNTKNLEILKESYYDDRLDETIYIAKKIPVILQYIVGNKRFEKTPDEHDYKMFEKINNLKIEKWYPFDRMINGIESRRNDKNGIKHVHQFYSKRNLYVLSEIYSRIKSIKVLFTFTSILINTTKMYKYRSNGKGSIVSGTLYIPTLNVEIDPLRIFKDKVKLYKQIDFPKENEVMISTGSTSELDNIPDNSIDYIFTDPPFGGNIMYSELNYIWECWLKQKTNNEKEAIVNRVHEKNTMDYLNIMKASLNEMYRILKPNRWITVEFSNTKDAIWNAIQESITDAGFIIADVRMLDKKQGSFKQVNTTTAMKQDLIISAYKPKNSFIEKVHLKAGQVELVWEFVKQHLEKIPPVIVNNGIIEKIRERENFMLFDRVVAFHIKNGMSIPINAIDFYRGLKEKFIERDGMYFVPNQILEYEEARAKCDYVEQLSFIVTDEKTAIQWLRMKLEESRQTYQEIRSTFLTELHQIKHEKLPELMDILEQNFLKDETGKWYVPDLSKQSDLEKIREKSLLKEFDEYLEGSKKLKQCRTEAVRAGFKKCWKDKEYETIVKVANRLPESVIQEDQTLLMYYDNALMRIEE